MRCPKCKRELPEQARFCLYCGVPIADEDAGAASKTGLGADAATEADEEGEGSEATGDLRGLFTMPDEAEALDAAGDLDDLGDLDEPSMESAIPAAKKLEEPLSPMAAGAVPLIAAAPPRASWASQRTPRHYASPSERMASRAVTYQLRSEDYVPQAEANDARANDPAPSETSGRAIDRAREDLNELGGRIKEEVDTVEPPRRRAMTVFAVVVGVLAVAFLVYVGASWIGPWSELVNPTPEVQLPDENTGGVEPVDLDDTGSSSQEEDAANTQATLPDDAPEVRSDVEDYSWTELSQIAALIADAQTDAEGYKIGATYGVCKDDGSLSGLETKDLELDDGTTVEMRVVGVRQDVTADGSVVGLSLVATESVGAVAWDDYARDNVGWEGSTLRSWLNDSLLDELPEELQELVVEVKKSTNQPAASGAAGQQTTDDKLWVPSYSELVGSLGLGSPRYGSYISEGNQYRLYDDMGVTWEDASAVALSGNSFWWLRSPDVSNGNWVLCVSPDGTPSYGNRPATQNEILIGFCL